MSRLPGLDPRMVSREMLMQRAGVVRPAATVIVFSDKRDNPDLAARVAQGETSGRRLQIVEAKPAGSPPGQAALIAEPDETAPVFANRVASNAIGEVLLLVLGAGGASVDALTGLIERLGTEPGLGVAASGLSLGEEPWGARGMIAVRGDVWSALAGLEEAYESFEMALRDLFLRARAIGFAAPDPLMAPEIGSGAKRDADRHLFARRAALAPDISAIAQRPRAGKIAVYTSILDCYDVLKPQPRRIADGADLVAFLDAPTAAAHEGRSRGWRVAEHPSVPREPHRASRFLKVNAHLAFPDTPATLWVDASISLVFPFSPARLVELFLADADMCVFRHYVRHSIYEEAEACKQARRDEPEVIDAQIARYRAEGLPEDSGLAELPVILRRDTPATRAFNEAWWAEIVAGSRRDQLSFNYVAWKLGFRYATFPLALPAGNGLFVKFRR